MEKRYMIVPPVFEQQLTGAAIVEYTRAKALALIWRFTHRDYKSTEGPRAVLAMVPGKGTCSIFLESFSDQQIEEVLPRFHSLELKRLEKLAAAKVAI